MQDQHFTTSFSFDKSPQEVFNAINDIRGWWSEDFTGHSGKAGDEFEVRFGDMHHSSQQLTEVVPARKVVWLVTKSHLSFLKKTDEWTGTHIVFELSESKGGTHLQFTHLGLVPQIECFGDCSKGWNYYLQQSFVPFINTGEGKPNKPVVENVHQ